LLAILAVGRIVIVSGTPSSGAALEKFTGKNRVVITATRSGQEGNDTVFYDYFLEALQSPAADETKIRKFRSGRLSSMQLQAPTGSTRRGTAGYRACIDDGQWR